GQNKIHFISTETDSSSVYSYATVPVVGGVIVLVAMVANCMKGGSAGGNPEGSSDKKPSNNPTTNASGTSSGAASNKPESSKEPNPDSQPQGKDNYKEILDFKAAMKKRQTENP
ncbi:hypothetical protein Btru_067880, partial [Bulinus truncatus]